MYRIQIEVMLGALAVVLSVAMAGLWLESLSVWAQTADLAQASYVALCVLASAALAGVGAGLRYGFPDGAGARSRKSLVAALRPTVAAAVTALLITTWASFQMATLPSSAEFQLSVLRVARWLDIGILILCFASAIGLVFESRRAGSPPHENKSRYTS
jgi:hypothetical protein